ncbi:MAG: hypothetical protein JW839_21480 [Candidatus Lokiarchaeota archaeon]|nr:hypothetical protein [Candidatus Lokiarchaeota archaeon]
MNQTTSQKPRVHTAFLFKHNAMFPYFGMNGEARRDFLLAQLKREVDGIEFIGGDIASDIEELEDVETRADVDAILVIAIASTIWPFPLWSLREDVDLALWRKKPMIVATDFLGGFYQLADFHQFSRRENLPVLTIQSSDFGDIKRALEKIKVIHTMKHAKVLSVGLTTPPQGSGAWVEELIHGEPMISWRVDPERYKKAVHDVFGSEIIYMSAEDFKQKFYDKVIDADAEKVADQWIEGASRVQVRDKDWVIRMARMYLSMKGAAKELGASAIQMDCRTVPRQDIMELSMKERGIELYGFEKPAWEFLKKVGSVPTFPCGANGRLTSEGIPSVGEGDIDSAVLNLMMLHMTGKPGFQNDPVIDTATNQVIYAHCGPTIMNWEQVGGPVQPYELRMNCAGCGVTFKGSFPLNKTFTSVMLKTEAKRIAVHEARSIGVIDKDDEHQGKAKGMTVTAERGSLNKFVAEVPDARKIFDKYEPATFGWHRNLYLGSYRQDVIDMARLLGLAVHEEDR